jgi:hypothetical protein
MLHARAAEAKKTARSRPTPRRKACRRAIIAASAAIQWPGLETGFAPPSRNRARVAGVERDL